MSCFKNVTLKITSLYGFYINNSRSEMNSAAKNFPIKSYIFAY